ncbi:thiomorpholine-carboxylate dehydrogenase [Aureococcus anophagefferens]|nr:thiomorpholine-carboxylate dehydrogenase [Aureococcus anophagefferens]
MPQVITKEELVASLPPVATIMDAMKAAYVQYSDGKAWVAPVSHVLIEGRGDACIKAGYVKHQSSWVVKVAGGFPGNAALGLSNSQGVMLLFSQRTGSSSVLGRRHLTDAHGGGRGALRARVHARGAQRLAVFGTGVIAKLVAEYCAPMFPDGELMVVSGPRRALAFGTFAATGLAPHDGGAARRRGVARTSS